MPTPYLFIFAQAHVEFRIPELISVSELHGFKITLSDNPEQKDPTRPFMVLGLDDEEHVRILARRCILIKSLENYAISITLIDQWRQLGLSMNFMHKGQPMKNCIRAIALPIQDGRDIYLIRHSDSSWPLTTTQSHNLVSEKWWKASPTWVFWVKLTWKVLRSSLDALKNVRAYHSVSLIWARLWLSSDIRHCGTTRSKNEGDGQFRQVYFGRLVRLLKWYTASYDSSSIVLCS